MTSFGLTLSSEEHAPRRHVELDEQHALDFVSISDHVHPWIEAQGRAPTGDHRPAAPGRLDRLARAITIIREAVDGRDGVVGRRALSDRARPHLRRSGRTATA